MKPSTPRTRQFIDEHLPLLEPFGVTKADIASLVVECNYDRIAVAAKIETLVNCTVEGRSTDEILWQQPRATQHAQVKPKPRKQNERQNHLNRPLNKTRDPQQASPSRFTSVGPKLNSDKTHTANIKPAAEHQSKSTSENVAAKKDMKAVNERKPEIEHMHSKKPVKTPEAAPAPVASAQAAPVRAGPSWADRIRGQTMSVAATSMADGMSLSASPEQSAQADSTATAAKKADTTVKTASTRQPEIQHDKGSQQTAPTQVFSWVAAVQGKRLQTPTAAPVDEIESEASQPVPDRVCDMPCTLAERVLLEESIAPGAPVAAPMAPMAAVTPPAGFEAVQPERAASRYQPSAACPPVIKQREHHHETPIEAAHLDISHRDVTHREVPPREMPHREMPHREVPHREAPHCEMPRRDSPMRGLPVRDSLMREAPHREMPLQHPMQHHPMEAHSPMYDPQRIMASQYLHRTAFNAYQQQLKYAVYGGGLDYYGEPTAPPAMEKDRDRFMPYQMPPMYHMQRESGPAHVSAPSPAHAGAPGPAHGLAHGPSHSAPSGPAPGMAGGAPAGYGYGATSPEYAPRSEYYMPRRGEMERGGLPSAMYAYGRPPVMPPMFAAAAGRSEVAAMVGGDYQHPPSMYYHQQMGRQADFHNSSSGYSSQQNSWR